jgi:DUF4097 and DUF4098 domain-containing protein YvlB
MRIISDFGFRISDFGKTFRKLLNKSEIRNPKSEIVVPLLATFLLFAPSLFAKCPVPPGATLVVRAPVGNLMVDTSGVDSVDVQVNNRQIEVKETCGKEVVEITGNAPAQMQETIEWKIVVPRSVHLDLVTLAGSINVGNTDANATLRTTGGAVVAGEIKGRAAIITQGGMIKSGNIGGDAELRSQGGSLEVGNVAGNAEFQTASGPIVAGVMNGRVNAKTAGGSITIREARGDLVANTDAGDISVGDARGIDAKTAGGNITGRRVRGPFQGHTESGDVRVESAAAWVEASTGFGNVFIRMVPENLEGDLHMDVQSGVGDVIVYLPEKMKAMVEATVERPAFEARRIFSDFPMNSIAPGRVQGLAPTPGRAYMPLRSQTLLNGGGNRVRLHTSLGKIEIRKN